MQVTKEVNEVIVAAIEYARENKHEYRLIRAGNAGKHRKYRKNLRSNRKRSSPDRATWLQNQRQNAQTCRT